MTKILLISRSWPPKERTGVSLAAHKHAQLLLNLGYEVAVLGAQDQTNLNDIGISNAAVISAKGTGALYAPVRINRFELRNAISGAKPTLVLVEAWQTALTDTSIEIANELGLPVLMVSHGISIHPFSRDILQIFRALAWLTYRFFKLPRLVKKITVITALDLQSKSNRFFDRELAKKMNLPLVSLKNAPINWSDQFIPKARRKWQILVVGYFSLIKNQLAAIELIRTLSLDLTLCFVGERTGSYFKKCQQAVYTFGLDNRVKFLQDDECDLGIEIASSLLIYSPSITEALPMVLIEAMASGTPFVANSVGAVPSLKGGIPACSQSSQLDAIKLLVGDDLLWNDYANAGLKQYKQEFSEACISEQLNVAVQTAINIHLDRVEAQS
jgi:glycosyltransferase involved in cell wall biosynthesis